MQTRASATDEALVQAHDRLLKDPGFQFDRVGFTPPKAPGWLRDPSGRSGSFAGHQIEGRVRWWLVPKRFRAEINGAWIGKGRFLEAAPGLPTPPPLEQASGQVSEPGRKPEPEPALVPTELCHARSKAPHRR